MASNKPEVVGEVKAKDDRSLRKGGLKLCEHCGKSFEAFRSWDKYCNNKCGQKVRAMRFWERQKMDKK